MAVGQARLKSWAMLVIPPEGTYSELWQERCRKYWDLQRSVYGFESTDFTMEFNTVAEGTPSQHCVLTTSVMITKIRPGARLGKPDWAKWKLKGGQN